MMTIQELSDHIGSFIAGGFGAVEMELMKVEIEKLQPSQVYLEIGVDEGRSLSVARYYADPEVWTVGVDYIDSPNRGPYMNIPLGWNPQGQSLVKHGSKLMFIHGDSQMVAHLWTIPISLLFIDGDHSYEGVSKDWESWKDNLDEHAVVLFHDYDHPDTRRFLEDTFGKNMEIFGNKIVKVTV